MSARRLAQRRRGDWGPALALVPIAVVLFGFEALPALSLVQTSFKTESGAFTLANYREVLGNPFYLVSIRNSLVLSLISAALGLGIGLFAAYALSRSGERLRQGMLTFVSMTINFAGVPLAFAYIILLGNSGIITGVLARYLGFQLYDHFSLYSWTGLGLVYTYFQVPLATLLLFPAFHGIRQEWQEAAAILGASTPRFWWSVGLPVLAPAILSAAAILFANAMGAYATAYALTTGILNILPLRISRLIAGEVNYQPGLAGAAAVVLGLIMILALVTSQTLVRRYRRVAT